MKFCLVFDNVAYIISSDVGVYHELKDLLDNIYKYNIGLFLILYNKRFGLSEDTPIGENSKAILEKYGEAPFLNPEFLKINNEVIQKWETQKVVSSSVLDWLRDKECNIEEIAEVFVL